MARAVRKEEAKAFVQKAEEFYQSALENYQKGRYNASVFDSSQSVILANDAFCIFALGRRPSKDQKVAPPTERLLEGGVYREAIQLHVQACSGKESKREIVAEAMEKRSEFGYTESESTAKEANLLLVRARRFLDWAKGCVGYEDG